MKVAATLIIVLATGLVLPSAHGQDFWEPSNGPHGGTFWALLATSQGSVIAGSDDAIYRSTNNGESWTKTFSDDTTGFVGVNTFARDSVGNLYVGTLLGTILKSTDDGITWNATGGSLGFLSVNGLAVNAMNHLFAGTSQGMRRSTNGGASWTTINTGLSSTFVQAVAIDPNNIIYAGTSGGVFRSTNNGANWAAMNTGLTSLTINALSFGDIRTTTATGGVQGFGTLYAGTPEGVFYYSESGATWNPIVAGLTTLVVYALLSNAQGDLFAATFGGGVFRLLAGATAWSEINVGLLPYLYIAALAITAQGYLFAAADWGGVYRSMDNGSTWVRRSLGLTAYFVTAMYYSAILNYLLVGTTTGFFASSDQGGNWSLLQHPNVFFWVTAMAATSTYLFAGTFFEGMWRSSDGGATWSAINNGLTNLLITALVINALGHLYVGTQGGGVFYSTDDGDSWSPLNNGLTTLFITALMLGPTGLLYAGTSGEGVFSYDSGTSTWTQIVQGLTTLLITALAFDALGYLYAGTQDGGVFRSTNLGALWVAVNVGLAYLFIEDLMYSSQVSLNSPGGGALFAAAGGHVFRSTDSGNNWSPVNGGLGNSFVARLAADSSGRLFAGTFWGGVFRNATPTSVRDVGKAVPTAFALRQNYPNPFNPSTTIELSVPSTEFVSISMFDILGREVTTLVNERLHPGTYKIRFDAAQLPSGVYFYRMNAGRFSETRKLMLLR